MVDNTFSCSNCAEVFPDTEAHLDAAGRVVCLNCCTSQCDSCGDTHYTIDLYDLHMRSLCEDCYTIHLE
jgi:formylmethanofuran dehydrogenase subunit E